MSAPRCVICKHEFAGHYCRDCESFICWRCWDLDQGMCKECVRDIVDSERAAKCEEPIEDGDGFEHEGFVDEEFGGEIDG